ncbi:homoserine kinase [Labrys miyagiensis]
MSGTPAVSVLNTKAPPVSEEKARRIAREHYGLAVMAKPLIGERDSNFHLKAADGQDYLLKVANPVEDQTVTDFQTRALMHMATRDPSLPVPRVVETVRGEPYFSLAVDGGQPRIVRMLTYLPGVPLARVERSPGLPRNLGLGLGRLDLALAGFSHPASGHELLWDLSHAAKLRPLIAHIDDSERQRLIGRVLDRLESTVFPRTASFRRQVIHNDFNPSNILVTGSADGPQDRLAGIIDFGDMVEAPLVNEVAVGASYHVAEEGDFLAPIKAFVAGYHAVLPLEEGEVDCLFDLLLARMTLTVVISAWRSTLEPDNRDYILRNAGRAWTGLSRAQALPPAQAAEEFHLHLARERTP